jgi:hypothetical protein
MDQGGREVELERLENLELIAPDDMPAKDVVAGATGVVSVPDA